MKFNPTEQDHLLNLISQIEILSDKWTLLRKHFPNGSETHANFCYRFIKDFIAEKPYALFGGPSTLISKVFEAMGTGGTDIKILTDGLMAAEKLVPGVSSVCLAKLGEVTKGTDKAGIVEQLRLSCGIVNQPSSSAVPLTLSMDKPKGMH